MAHDQDAPATAAAPALQPAVQATPVAAPVSASPASNVVNAPAHRQGGRLPSSSSAAAAGPSAPGRSQLTPAPGTGSEWHDKWASIVLGLTSIVHESFLQE
jgi:hypothetical protein